MGARFIGPRADDDSVQRGIGRSTSASRPGRSWLAMTNDWCRTLGIEQSALDAVAHHREANTFALLLVALLERGHPMTLAEAAMRFEEAGIAGRAHALSSLKRCKPGRPPVYRDGDPLSSRSPRP
jgi:hypothetical protein